MWLLGRIGLSYLIDGISLRKDVSSVKMTVAGNLARKQEIISICGGCSLRMIPYIFPYQLNLLKAAYGCSNHNVTI